MLHELPVLSSGFGFSNSNYNYDNTNTGPSVKKPAGGWF
jgi:hypothetical protein